jgi:hypothetical protein
LDEFLAITTSLPTAVYSVLVLISLGYWMVGMLGLAGDHGDGDADVGDFGHGDADVDLDVGDADVDLDVGDADVDLDVGGHGHAAAGHGHEAGALDAVMGVMSFLRLRNAPLSITFSVLFLAAWACCFLGAQYVLPHIPGPGWLAGTLLGLGALLPAIPIASVVTKPLAPLFKQDFAPGKHHLVGRVGVVRIGGDKGKSAQIRLKDPRSGEKGLLIRVALEEDIASGDEVLLVDYDDDRHAYVAEPMEKVLPTKGTESSEG